MISLPANAYAGKNAAASMAVYGGIVRKDTFMKKDLMVFRMECIITISFFLKVS